MILTLLIATLGEILKGMLVIHIGNLLTRDLDGLLGLLTRRTDSEKTKEEWNAHGTIFLIGRLCKAIGIAIIIIAIFSLFLGASMGHSNFRFNF